MIDESEELPPRPLDDVLSTAGVFGVIQVSVHISVFYLMLIVTGQVGAFFFTGYSPPWKCTASRSSDFCYKHYNTTFSVDMELFNQRCSLNRTEWRYVTDTTSSFVTEFDLVCTKTSTVALIGVAYYLGCVLGVFLLGPIGDMWGRKRSLTLFLVVFMLSSIAIRYVGAVWHLYPLQLACGAGTVGSIVMSFIYISEFTPPRYRSTALNIHVLCQYISFMLLDLLACFLKRWRLLSMYLAFLSLPFLAISFFLPESPRWLLTKRRWADAELILTKINQFNGKIKVQVMRERSENHPKNKVYTYWDIVSNCRVLCLTLQISSLWVVLPVLYYTISAQSMNYSCDVYLNYLLASMADVPAFFLVTYTNDAIGRKKTTLFGCLLSGILIGLVPAIPRSFHYNYLFKMGLTVAARLCCSVAFSGVWVWTSELFPTVMRAQGMAVCGIFEKAAMIGVPVICTLLQSLAFYLPFIVMGVMGVLGFLIGLPLPETKNQQTREAYEDFFAKKVVAVINEVGIDNDGSEQA